MATVRYGVTITRMHANLLCYTVAIPLIKKQIFSKVYFKPIHLTSFYKKKFNEKEGMLPITEKISKTVLTLPLYPNMTQEEKKYLIDTIHEFFNR